MPTPLRLLTVGHSYTIGLNRALIREIAADRRFEVTVAAPRRFRGDLRPLTLDPEPPGSPLLLQGVGARCTGLIHVFQYHHAELKALLRSKPFDVVHAWEEPYIYAGYQIARELGEAPSRFCFRTAQSYVKWYPPPFGYFEQAVLARAQGWIAGASLVHQAMLQRGYPKERGHILNLAVDVDLFHPHSSAEKAEARRQLQINSPVIGFVGRLTPAKGVPVLMAALDRLPSALQWNLLLLGSGPSEPAIRDWARKRGWLDRIHIRLVRHEEVPRFLGCMDLLVAPSQTMPNWREQFGRMLIEAFASGVPVIGSDSGEIPFVIGEAGIVVPEKDVAGWASAIESLLDDPLRRAELAQRGLERVREFSTHSMARRFTEFYLWLRDQPRES